MELTNKRLLSLDALRGFDMFWIISGEGVFHGFANAVMSNHSLTRNPHDWTINSPEHLSIFERTLISISNQLHHTPWNGFTFYDMIFPLFIFISGISMPFSYQKFFHNSKQSELKTNKRKLYLALIQRTLLLIFLGMVVNGLFNVQSYEEIRFASVLGKIGLATCFAAIIYINCSMKMQIFWFVFILTGYCGLMTFVPVPGYGPGVLTTEGNLSAYIDRQFLPGKLHRTVYDPEGLLSTIPAIASALLGIFTGQFLKSSKNAWTPKLKTLGLIGAGVALLLSGMIWSQFFPINKTMWTSSFVLYSGGWSMLLLAVFYYIIDAAEFRKWSMPFVWIGTNSILIYMAAHGIVNFESTAKFLFGGMINMAPPQWHQAWMWTGVLVIQLKLLQVLYDKKIFLKI